MSGFLSLFSDAQVPGLAVVIVGTRKDSQSYVSMKRKACAEVGIQSVDVDLPEQISEEEVIAKVHELNENPDVHGSLLRFRSLKFIFLCAITIENDRFDKFIFLGE